jgi:hypothetical protein
MAKAPTSSDQDPGTETDIPSVDEKLNALDDDLNPVEPDQEEPEATEPPVEDEPEEQEKSPKAEEEELEEEEDKEVEEPEGYTIDEGEEAAKPVKQPEVTSEDQYILDGVKDSAITVRGTIGDAKEVKEYKVLSPQQLPRGFHYLDDYEAGVAFTAFNALERKAQELQGQYRQEQANNQTQEITEKERQADRSDIARMQKAGTIDLFKASPDDSNFESDPAVELVQSVLDFKNKLNTQYNEAYSNGAAYRHIGFEEAFYRFQRENPTKGNPAQAKEDKERKEFARRTNRPNAGRPANKTPKVPAGASSRDLDMYIENLEI